MSQKLVLIGTAVFFVIVALAMWKFTGVIVPGSHATLWPPWS